MLQLIPENLKERGEFKMNNELQHHGVLGMKWGGGAAISALSEWTFRWTCGR